MAQKRTGPRLVFVYNAESGLLSAAADALHKLVSPRTYGCALCAITYGAVTMRREWKDYLSRLPYPAEFLHRDEFQARWPGFDVTLPAILLDRGGLLPEVLVRSGEMRRNQRVSELIATLDAALARRAAQAGQAV